MSFFDKMLDAMNLGDGDDDEYYEEELDVEKKSRGRNSNNDSSQKTSKITPMRKSSSSQRSSSMEVCVIKPSSFEDVREITDTLLANRTVILNMEGLDMALAQRIIDFISGACYAIEGNLQKVSNFIFILTPHSVDISGDIQSLMDAFDLTGLTGSGF
ncbi:MAG: cell division protein SepF [Lachnospiraceae bacterium]|nr:cell division protein SepF [Lachnospiraceae bacterium]